MPNLIPVLSKTDIEKAVADLAHKISSDDQNHELILIGVLKGAFILLADLARHLTNPVKRDFVRLTSCGMGTRTSGNMRMNKLSNSILLTKMSSIRVYHFASLTGAYHDSDM